MTGADRAPVDLDALAAGLGPMAATIDPVANRFTGAGHRLYLVGGIVRDLLLGRSGYDVDLTTDARPGAIKALVGGNVDALWTQGERFGTIGARLAGVAGDGPGPVPTHLDLEITTHRAEAYDPASRKPVVTFGDSLDDDLSRRDFTVNAMAVEVPLGSPVTADSVGLIDPYGGVADLAAGVLRTPLSPEISFTDDPLRMLRAARFSARFALAPTPDLEAAAAEHAHRLGIVSVERIAGELERLLALPDPSVGLAFLDRTGVLDHAVPALASLEPADRARALGLAAADGPVAVRRAGLFHPLGPERAGRALSRLRYSNDDRRLTVDLIETTAGRPVNADGRSSADSAPDQDRAASGLRRAVRLVGVDHVDELRQLAANLGDQAMADGLDRLAATEDLADLGSPLTGADIMAITGLEPGPRIGQAQRRLIDHRLDHGPLSRDQAVAVVQRWLAEDE